MGLQQPTCVSLLLAILVQCTVAKKAGDLIIEGNDTPIYVGFSRIITCTWTGAEEITKLDWYQVGMYDEGIGMRGVSIQSTALNTGRVSDTTWNEKRFSCIATTISGRSVVKTIALMVKEREYQINITKDKPNVCNYLTLTCTVWCEVPVTVKWFSNNEDTVVNTTSITVSKQRTYGFINVINITFKPLLLSHEGIYKCILTTKTLRREKSYSVGVSRLRQAYPISGSIIDILGAENIMLFCELGNGELVQTVWLLLTENDMQNGRKPVNVLGDDRFILTGDIIVSGGFNTSLNTNMTIVEITTELKGAVIFCGTGDCSFLGNFTLGANTQGKAQRICILSTTTTTAVIEVELSSQGTPPLMIVMEIIGHPELCCNNITTYLHRDTVHFDLDGLSEGTAYKANVSVENLLGRGPEMQFFFTTDSQSTIFPSWLKAVISVCCFIILAIFILIVCLLICLRYRQDMSKIWRMVLRQPPQDEVLPKETTNTSAVTPPH